MTKPIHTDIYLTVDFDDEFDRQVGGDGRAYNPRVSLEIGSGDTSISGPEKGYTGVYLTHFLGAALEAIQHIKDGDKQIIKTGDGPVYLVFEPQDDETVVLTKCFTRASAENTDEKSSVEPQLRVTRQALVDEIIRLSKESLGEILETNPEVRDYRQILELREMLRRVEDQR